MCQCHAHTSCHSCRESIHRRGFLQGVGAAGAMAVGGLTSLAGASDSGAARVRIAAVFLANTKIREIWPYPDFDATSRRREILTRLKEGCPRIEFVPLTVENAGEVQQALAMKDRIDGYLVYTMTLDWALRKALVDVATLGKPTIVANEFLGGCGVFLTGYVSDPALDTAKNQIVYAHCVATTRAFGPQGRSNRFRIMTLHNRDPRGACGQSFLPSGYMTTSFRTNFGRKEMIIHQARTVGNLESEYGCRTKLVADVCGDIGKLFDQWDKFGWHRVTVYGDVKEPLTEFGKALGLKVIQEA